MSSCCSLFRNMRNEGWRSKLRLSAFRPESHSSCTNSEPFILYGAWIFAILSTTTSPVSVISAHKRELVSCLLTADLFSYILVIRRFDLLTNVVATAFLTTEAVYHARVFFILQWVFCLRSVFVGLCAILMPYFANMLPAPSETIRMWVIVYHFCVGLPSAVVVLWSFFCSH